MTKFAFIFPGQGSQCVGMGLDLYNNFDQAKQVFDFADSILKKEISKMCFYGPEESLKQTINSQSAIVATSIAALEVFKNEMPIKPICTLGHSLGEYCALYCAGAFDLKTTFEAIQKRSELMDLATKDHKGSMAAVIGCDVETITKCIEQVGGNDKVQIANYNAPSQIVITGISDAIDEICILLKQSGAKRVVPLAVSGAFHSSQMNSAKDEFELFVKNIAINNTDIPVITNVDSLPTKNSEEFRKKLPIQINSSVMWYQSILRAMDLGADTFIEFGNGKVLAGLNRKISSEIKTYNISDKKSLDDTKEQLLLGV